MPGRTAAGAQGRAAGRRCWGMLPAGTRRQGRPSAAGLGRRACAVWQPESQLAGADSRLRLHRCPAVPTAKPRPRTRDRQGVAIRLSGAAAQRGRALQAGHKWAAACSNCVWATGAQATSTAEQPAPSFATARHGCPICNTCAGRCSQATEWSRISSSRQSGAGASTRLRHVLEDVVRGAVQLARLGALHAVQAHALPGCDARSGAVDEDLAGRRGRREGRGRSRQDRMQPPTAAPCAPAPCARCSLPPTPRAPRACSATCRAFHCSGALPLSTPAGGPTCGAGMRSCALGMHRTGASKPPPAQLLGAAAGRAVPRTARTTRIARWPAARLARTPMPAATAEPRLAHRDRHGDGVDEVCQLAHDALPRVRRQRRRARVALGLAREDQRQRLAGGGGGGVGELVRQGVVPQSLHGRQRRRRRGLRRSRGAARAACSRMKPDSAPLRWSMRRRLWIIPCARACTASSRSSWTRSSSAA